jgi:prophage maintenance system killer protein
MLAFLELNGKKLKVGQTSRFNIVVWAVKPQTNIEEIVTWIANHTRGD